MTLVILYSLVVSFNRNICLISALLIVTGGSWRSGESPKIIQDVSWPRFLIQYLYIWFYFWLYSTLIKTAGFRPAWKIAKQFGDGLLLRSSALVKSFSHFIKTNLQTEVQKKPKKQNSSVRDSFWKLSLKEQTLGQLCISWWSSYPLGQWFNSQFILTLI